MGLRKNYEELTGNPSFPDGLSVNGGIDNEDGEGLWGPWVLEHGITENDIDSDVSVYTTFDLTASFRYKLVCRRVKPATLGVRVNNNTTDYQQVNLSEDGNLSRDTTRDELLLIDGPNVGAHGTWDFSNSQRTTVSGHGASRFGFNATTMLTGGVETSVKGGTLQIRAGSQNFELDIYRYDSSNI